MQCKVKEQVRDKHQPEFVACRALKVSASFDPQLPDLFRKIILAMKCTSKVPAEKSQLGLQAADMGSNRNGVIQTFQHETLS